MTKTTETPSLFERLKAGLEEGIQFARGETDLHCIEVISPPPDWTPQQIARLRKKLQLAPNTFAQLLNVSPRTLRRWESGESKPAQTALRLLQILNGQPDIIEEIAGPNGDTMKNHGSRKSKT